MKLKRKTSSRSHLAALALTPEVVRHVVSSDPKMADYTYKCLVKHPPHAKPRTSRRYSPQGQRLRELVVNALANDLFGHINWASLASEIVAYEAARRYVERKYPAMQVRLRLK